MCVLHSEYIIPEKVEVIAHQVIAADVVGDDDLLQHISETLKVPVSRINPSNQVHYVRMAIRGKLCLQSIEIPSSSIAISAVYSGSMRGAAVARCMRGLSSVGFCKACLLECSMSQRKHCGLLPTVSIGPIYSPTSRGIVIAMKWL